MLLLRGAVYFIKWTCPPAVVSGEDLSGHLISISSASPRILPLEATLPMDGANRTVAVITSGLPPRLLCLAPARPL
jgi:hypothetical protein